MLFAIYMAHMYYHNRVFLVRNQIVSQNSICKSGVKMVLYVWIDGKKIIDYKSKCGAAPSCIYYECRT